LSGQPEAAEGRPIRTFRQAQGRTWWLGRRSYFLYMVREFTVIPMSAWLLWFLYEVYRLRQRDYEGPSAEDYAFLAFSVICLFFTLWHALTFLTLSGLILRIPVGDRFIPAGAIKALALGGLVAATVVGGALLIYLGTVRL
jgi:fumarate reductase subunit C